MIFIMNRTDQYRLLALLELARIHPASVPAADIARSRDIPGPYLARLLAELARAGLVTTRRGAGGGVALARDPRRLPVRAILANDSQRPAAPEVVDRLERRLSAAMADALDHLTLADLAAWELECHDVSNYVI